MDNSQYFPADLFRDTFGMFQAAQEQQAEPVATEMGPVAVEPHLVQPGAEPQAADPMGIMEETRPTPEALEPGTPPMKMPEETAGETIAEPLEVAEGGYTEGAPPETPEDWEAEWARQYDITAKDLIGEEQYNQLMEIANEKPDLVEIFGTMGMIATNPEAGYRMMEQTQARRDAARKSLLDLESNLVQFKKAGLAQIAQNRRNDAAIAQRLERQQLQIDAQEIAKRREIGSELIAAAPRGVISPPSETLFQDRDAFAEWYGKASGDLQTYTRKQTFDSLLYNPREGLAQLGGKWAIDPSEGLINTMREYGFTDEEIQARMPQIRQFSALAARQKRMMDAEERKLEGEVERLDKVSKSLDQRTEYFRTKMNQIGQESPNTRKNFIASMQKHLAYLNKQNTEYTLKAQLYQETRPEVSRMFYNSALEAQTHAQDVQWMLQQAIEEDMDKIVTRAQAFGMTLPEAYDATMEAFPHMFTSIDEVNAILTMEDDGSDKELATAKNMFYSYLIAGVMNKSGGGHPMDVLNDLDPQVDEMLGTDVTIPFNAAAIAAASAGGPSAPPNTSDVSMELGTVEPGISPVGPDPGKDTLP